MPSAPGRIAERPTLQKQLPQPRILDLGAECLPPHPEAQVETVPPGPNLVEEFQQLKLELKKYQFQLKEMREDLSHAHAKITQLKQDVDYWKNEVTQLQDELRQQHADDVAVLNELSNELGRILSEQRNAQEVTNEPLAQ
ncbi:hypothetical protein AB1L42_19710 [Thalassoglobus sp. JC818]|uniref:hypothetical protein n=1 Tax=Thalassoglobus sp. JC818 TaxID=3232136 RepID=UPI0034592EA5